MNLVKNKKSIILIIIIMIIIAGTTVKLIKGMNYDLNWTKSISINFETDKELDKIGLSEILNEVFVGKLYKIKNVENDSKNLLITLDSTEITDEEKNSFIEKINTRYEEDLEIYDLEIINNDQIKLSDVLKPYIIPLITSIVIIIIYFAIRYKKIGVSKIIENLLDGIVLPQWVYFSVLAIFRIPVGAMAIPISMLVLLISIITLIVVFDKQYKKVSTKNNKKRK